MTELGFEQIIFIEVALVFAYFLKGFSGFGPALVFIPTVSIVFDPFTAIASSAFIDLFVGIAMLLTLKYEKSDVPVVSRMAIWVVSGSVVGALLAGVVPESALLAMIALAVFGLGIWLPLRRTRTVDRPDRPGLLALGCTTGGITGGLVGISGPPIVGVARSLMDKSTFRRRMAALFLIEGCVKLAVYGLNDVWSGQVLEVAMLALPAVLVGLTLGYRLHKPVREESFDFVVGLILIGVSIRVFMEV